MWNKKRIKSTQKQENSLKHVVNLQTHSAYIKLWVTLQCLTTLKIGKLPITANSPNHSPNLCDLTICGELLLTTDSPNLSDLTISRVTVNG